MPICRARIGLKHFQKPIEKVRDPRDPRDPRDLRTRALFVYLLPGQTANIGGFARTFFLNSESEKISTMRIAQDLY